MIVNLKKIFSGGVPLSATSTAVLKRPRVTSPLPIHCIDRRCCGPVASLVCGIVVARNGRVVGYQPLANVTLPQASRNGFGGVALRWNQIWSVMEAWDRQSDSSALRERLLAAAPSPKRARLTAHAVTSSTAAKPGTFVHAQRHRFVSAGAACHYPVTTHLQLQQAASPHRRRSYRGAQRGRFASAECAARPQLREARHRLHCCPVAAYLPLQQAASPCRRSYRGA